MNLKGGYKILLLSTLSLVEVATAITDKKVIEQLSTLIGYMGEKELKPILIHCEIEKDSTITKHCVMGELKKISDTEYAIISKIDKAYLIISVEFSQNEETEEYYIASGDARYILSETTKVSDLVVDGVIIADVVLQKPRYEFDFDLPDTEGLTKEQWYTKVIIIGNECHIIGNVKYTNNTENAINQRFSAFNVQIPEEIAPFIIDMDGKSLSEEPTSGKQTIRVSAVYNFGDDVNVHALRLNHLSDRIIQFYENQSTTIPANGGILNKGFHITLMLTE